ncbi:hypothetical protein BD414DRAFT_475789 [Trametes punicea]|nr:hypothetical protein BD414DRAFT_475789 [Trametes punicea]
MFLLPFVLAGVFMLTVLNPRYTAMLVSQTIPRSPLLERAFSPVVGLLVASPQGPSTSVSPLMYQSALSQPSDMSEAITVGPYGQRMLEGTGLSNSSNEPLMTLFISSYERCLPGSPEALSFLSTYSEHLVLALVFILLYLLWCLPRSLDRRFRVLQPLFAASSVVENLVTHPGPQTFTPRDSPELHGLAINVVDEELNAIPAKLEFVAPDAGSAQGSSFVVNTRAAIDAILALPLRICTASLQSVGDVDEPLEVTSSPRACAAATAVDDDFTPGMAQGIQRLLSHSRERLSTPKETSARYAEGDFSPHNTATALRATSGASSPGSPCQTASESNPLSAPTEGLHTHVASREGSQTQYSPSTLLEDAVTFRVVKLPPSKTASANKAGSPSVQRVTSGAFIEEVEEPQGTSDAPMRPQENSRQRGPPRRPRPKNPPVTVWPSTLVDGRRTRMPSGQPSNSSGNWDRPRRSRTVSGI